MTLVIQNEGILNEAVNTNLFFVPKGETDQEW